MYQLNFSYLTLPRMKNSDNFFYFKQTYIYPEPINHFQLLEIKCLTELQVTLWSSMNWAEKQRPPLPLYLIIKDYVQKVEDGDKNSFCFIISDFYIFVVGNKSSEIPQRLWEQAHGWLTGKYRHGLLHRQPHVLPAWWSLSIMVVVSIINFWHQTLNQLKWWVCLGMVPWGNNWENM